VISLEELPGRRRYGRLGPREHWQPSGDGASEEIWALGFVELVAGSAHGVRIARGRGAAEEHSHAEHGNEGDLDEIKRDAGEAAAETAAQKSGEAQKKYAEDKTAEATAALAAASTASQQVLDNEKAVAVAKNGTIVDNPQGATPTGIPIGSSNGFPKHASDTLSTIRLTNAPPSGFRGGGSFANDGRGGGQVLPGSTTDGTPITYREFDVYPLSIYAGRESWT